MTAIAGMVPPTTSSTVSTSTTSGITTTSTSTAASTSETTSETTGPVQPTPSSGTPAGSGISHSKVIAVGVGVGLGVGAAVLALGCIGFFIYRRRRNAKHATATDRMNTMTTQTQLAAGFVQGQEWRPPQELDSRKITPEFRELPGTCTSKGVAELH
ncbi:hypothetical protein AJ79_05300 [Helicocarpus griseus UAMH5409]|uniref:Mid2 domain-containing protein n=1 Tax=Helicocarpus griseus UAMH5409 TaxID=1447875 RepID=A0A2B7XP04_9EURO|nr:hypothetical protein AJ79_05300 [Helicocarpus griseus UAMH5409]